MMKAFYICGTHWDREWYEPFQEYRMWLVQMLDQAIDRLQAEPEHRVFHLDGQAVMIEDYLEIRPERRAELSALLAAGRLIAGPWYAMPDLWLVSGEALIRNLTVGMRAIRNLGAKPMSVGYAPDLFGHIGSLPMIFSGLGLSCAVVWRGLNDDQAPAQFVWLGPDGSRVLTHHLPDNIGYGWFGGRVRWPWRDAGFDDALLTESAPGVMADEAARGSAPVLYLSDAGDHQAMPERVPRMLARLGEACPDIAFIHGAIEDYFAELGKHATGLVEVSGDLRSAARRTGTLYHALIPHCLSSRYPLKQANDRCQNGLTLWAEPLAALAWAHGHPVPPGYLETAWKWLLKNQPHDSICGCSVDATHADMPFRFHQAEGIGDGVRRQAMARLATPTDTLKAAGQLVVWNPLPWPRRGAVEVELCFPADYPAKALRSGHTGPVLNQFDLLDAAGTPRPYHVLAVETGRTVKMPDKTGRRMVVGSNLDLYRLVVDMELPACGYTGLTVRPLEGVGRLRRTLGSLRLGPLEAANEHLRIRVQPEGTVELENRATGAVYRDLFQYEDSGDVGDGWNYVPPVCNRTVVSPGHSVSTSVVEDGPLQVTFRIDRVLRIPAASDARQSEHRAEAMVDMPVSDYLTVRAGDPCLHVRTVVDNTACDHRLRVLFPTDIAADSYWSDQPFHWLRRPVATDPASDEYKEPDPVERPHHTVFALGDDGGLAVLCPEGLHEHSVYDDRRRTLALTLFRGVRKTPTTDGEPGAQTPGRLDFRYALAPYTGDLPQGQMVRRVAELQAGVQWHLSETPAPSRSLLRVEADACVATTAIKPGADGQSLVVRLWNTGATEAAARIQGPESATVASLCNLAEETTGKLDVDRGRVALKLAPFALATVKLS